MIDRQGKPETANSVQELQNNSFDREFQVNAVELLGYNQATNTLHRVSVDGSGSITPSNPTAGFGLFKVDENGTDTYITKEKADGTWMVMKIDSTVAATYATINNNPTILTATQAQANILTLTYNVLSVAF